MRNVRSLIRRKGIGICAAPTILVLAGTPAVLGVVAQVTHDGPFTGCLASNTGDVYNVAPATLPLAPCFAGDRLIRFSNGHGPRGANGDPGPAGSNGLPGLPGLSKSFWSGPTAASVVAARDEIVTSFIAATGPIPPSWWTVTGQLALRGSGVAYVGCDLVSPEGTQLATLFTTARVKHPVTVPIRVLVDQSSRPAAAIAEIACTVVGGPPHGGSVVAEADLLIVPTEAGQIGVKP